jgi:hypothetical protein
MRRTSITAAQLLHRLLLNTDSFLPNALYSLDSPLYRSGLFYRRFECFGANRTATDSAAANLILSHAQARREARVHAAEVPRKSQQEKIMKYLLLIAALITLTGATSISSSEAGCCGGGACCPGACCMTMTR